MRHLVVKNGAVANIVEYDGTSPYEPPKDHTLHAYDGPADIGWKFDGGKAIAPPAPPRAPKRRSRKL